MTEPAHDLDVNRELWTLVNAEFTDAQRVRGVGRGRDHVGDL